MGQAHARAPLARIFGAIMAGAVVVAVGDSREHTLAASVPQQPWDAITAQLLAKTAVLDSCVLGNRALRVAQRVALARPETRGRATSYALLPGQVVTTVANKAVIKQDQCEVQFSQAGRRLAAIVPMNVLAPTASADTAHSSPAATPPKLNYGLLGPMAQRDFEAMSSLDPKIMSRSPASTLALFRHNEAHPPRGTLDEPIGWDEILEHEEYQRALFYSAAQRAPALIAPNDWKLVRAEEKDLSESVCDNWGGSGVPTYGLTEKQCDQIIANEHSSARH